MNILISLLVSILFSIVQSIFWDLFFSSLFAISFLLNTSKESKKILYDIKDNFYYLQTLNKTEPFSFIRWSSKVDRRVKKVVLEVYPIFIQYVLDPTSMLTPFEKGLIVFDKKTKTLLNNSKVKKIYGGPLEVEILGIIGKFQFFQDIPPEKVMSYLQPEVDPALNTLLVKKLNSINVFLKKLIILVLNPQYLKKNSGYLSKKLGYDISHYLVRDQYWEDKLYPEAPDYEFLSGRTIKDPLLYFYALREEHMLNLLSDYDEIYGENISNFNMYLELGVVPKVYNTRIRKKNENSIKDLLHTVYFGFFTLTTFRINTIRYDIITNFSYKEPRESILRLELLYDREIYNLKKILFWSDAEAISIIKW